MTFSTEQMSLIGLLLTVAGGWWWWRGRITARVDALEAKMRDTRQEQSKAEDRFETFRDHASNTYASVAHLKDVEERLVKAIDRVVDKLDEVQRAIVARPASRRTTSNTD